LSGTILPFMFQSVLKDVVDSTEGGVASLVMDLDGIALDSYTTPDPNFDIQMVGIELSVVIRGVQQAATMLDAGTASEIAIVADQLITLVRMVNETYFVALSLVPGSNLGKARYVLRTRVPSMVAELS
jgi:predicted regulator of Ras-like GTPase activity (Roadblock/LC7/MglB family)